MPGPLPVRRLVLVLGGVAVLVVVAFSGLALADRYGRTTAERTSTLDATTPRLTVRTEAGDIHVRRSADQHVHVRTVAKYALQAPKLTSRSDRGGILLRSECPSLPVHCEVRYEVDVPAAFEVDLHSSAGDVTARDLTGAARLESSAGDLTALQLTGRLQLRTSAGNVAGRGLTADVDAVSSAGDVELSFAAPPAAVRAESSAGEVTVAVPGGPYRVDEHTSAGSATCEVPTDPAAPRRITARSSAGDVRVTRSE